MKHPILALALVASTTACSLFTPKVAKTILDVADVACVIAIDWVGSDYRELAKACNLAEDAIPEIRKLVEAKRMAASKAAKTQSACPSTSTSNTAPAPSSSAPVTTASVSATTSTTPAKPPSASASASSKPLPTPSSSVKGK